MTRDKSPRDDDRLRQDVNAAGLRWEIDHGTPPIEYITLAQYFGDKPHTPEQEANAVHLLAHVNAYLADYVADGGVLTIDPDTGTYISGAKGGNGDGGFRLPNSTTGAPKSKHRSAQAVDVSDQDEALDVWTTDEKLAEHGLYRESPLATITWCHLQNVAPGSGNRTYFP